MVKSKFEKESWGRLRDAKTEAKLIGICALLLLNHLCFGSGRPLAFAQNKIIAIVNNDAITQKDLDDFVNFMRIQLSKNYKGGQLENKIQSLKSDLLNKLIEDRLILQEARRNNIIINEAAVKEKIDEIKKRYDSEIEFQNTLVKDGLTQSDIEERIREQLLLRGIVEIKIKRNTVVKPQEITDFYQKNGKEFTLPEQREFESMVITDENLALAISDKLKNRDGSIRELAKEYALTVNKISAMRDGELRRDIEEAVFTLKPQEVSGPLKIGNKYYIFKLNNIILARQQKLSEAQDKIYGFLLEKKIQEGLNKWLDELKIRSYIQITQE